MYSLAVVLHDWDTSIRVPTLQVGGGRAKAMMCSCHTHKTSLIVFDSESSKPETQCILTHLTIYNHPSAALVQSRDFAFPIVLYLSRFTSI
jgi:hypothetical protein